MKHFLLILATGILFSQCTQAPKTEPVKQYSIEQFYKNLNIGGGSFSSDGSKLLVTSNETGIYNVYFIDIATGTRTALTQSDKESYYGIGFVPGTDDVLFTADQGGNEINHIYLRKASGEITDLTPGEAKAGFDGWNLDKTAFYFTWTKRDPKFFDLYKMDIKTWKPEMVFENKEGIDLGSLSNNEQIMSFTQSITTSTNKLFLLDIKSGEKTELSKANEDGSYGAMGFSNNDEFFYYTTTAGKEFSYLVERNMKTGEEKTLFETNWDVSYSYTSRNETYRVTGINEDGKNTLMVTNLKTNEAVNFPAIPDGNITGVGFSDDEKQMRLSVGTSLAPGNIYVYNFESKELKKLTETLNPEINPNDLVSAEVVRYKSFDGLEIPAIYYKPKNASASNKVPGLVWVHGGPGGQSRVGYFALIQYLVNHGYAVLAVNNRGSSGYGKTFYRLDDKNHGENDLQDCIYGKKWLQSQDYIDADKIGIIGGSYGGYMTMAAMSFTPDEFKVGVNIFGVTNWLRTLKSIPPFWESFRKALYEEIGDPNTDDSVRLYRISPLFHASNVKNPVMVLQGANDPRVLQVESDEIVEAIRKNNIPVEYVVFPDEGHGFVKKENEIKGYGQILTFLNRYLKQETTEALKK